MSGQDMTNVSDVSEEKLVALEMQISFLEVTVETLNDQVIAQQQMVAALKHEQTLMKSVIQKLVGATNEDSVTAPFDPLLERPPHY